MIQTLTPKSANHAFHIGSLPRRAWSRKDFMDARSGLGAITVSGDHEIPSTAKRSARQGLIAPIQAVALTFRNLAAA
jgi:hypothetical protein